MHAVHHYAVGEKDLLFAKEQTIRISVATLLPRLLIAASQIFAPVIYRVVFVFVLVFVPGVADAIYESTRRKSLATIL